MNTELSNPFSTGGGGPNFEVRVQAAFVALMLTGGFAPGLPGLPIKKMKLQGKLEGYDTDDLIVFVESPDGSQKRKMLAQIKRTVSITKNDKKFREVISAAWNDFNGCGFSKNEDIIALITGPLSATDVNHVRTILEWARYSNTADEFINKVCRSYHSNDGKRRKLQAFRTQLKYANATVDQPVEDEILFEFLKHFHLLGYDLDIKAGVSLSLLHSLIHQYSEENVQNLWGRLVDEVMSANQNAGTISRDNLSGDLRDTFKQRVYESIPEEFVSGRPEPEEWDWSQYPHVNDLALANLIGTWNENNEDDRAVIQQLTGLDYFTWIGGLREILEQPNSPVALNNGKWRIKKRKELWKSLGGKLFDNHIDTFKQCIVKVLKGRDPQFDLPADERYAASIHGKELSNSSFLRNGMTESLALLGNYPEVLVRCSQNKPQETAVLTVHEIFADADWVLWGSLGTLLPVLAEAAPDNFLDILEKALRSKPCPFDELFSQEGAPLTGSNYMTGLLWALETLAWDAEHLVRVCIILGKLAAHDPGGPWANRPANSLTEIILPWHPQTIAPIEDREVAVKTLINEVPDEAWNLLVSLLPRQHQMSSGTRKPTWQNTIPDGWDAGVTSKDYWKQVNTYAEMAISMASNDIDKLAQLVGILDKSGSPSFDKLLEHLSSEEICGKPEDQRLKLWRKLTELAAKHRRFSDTERALSDKTISKIKDVAAKLAPQNPFNLHRRLFSHDDLALYEGTWGDPQQEQKLNQHRQKLDQSRKQAIKEILAYGGMDMVLQFAGSVESSWDVGRSLGAIANAENDNRILPALLETDNTKLEQFVSAYIRSRQDVNEWEWVDGFDTSNWSVAQIGQFLAYLPFTKETWHRATDWLGKSEKEYWSNTSANPYRDQTHGDLSFAIDKLIKYGRPHAAIACLRKMIHSNQPLDKSRSVKALMAAISSREPSHVVDLNNIIPIIKALQNDPDTDPDALFQIEWAYLNLLDEHYYAEASPKTLENRLSSGPEFFCEVIRLVYPSKKETESPKELSEQEKAIAENAYKLLDKWKTPPGTQSDGQFLPEQFTEWLNKTREACAKSGHLDVALMQIGKVLIHAPSDPEGLWIHRTVASALNADDADDMRNGFRTGIFNAQGRSFGPTEKSERERIKKYKQKAKEIENAGYYRFAIALKKLVEEHERLTKIYETYRAEMRML